MTDEQTRWRGLAEPVNPPVFFTHELTPIEHPAAEQPSTGQTVREFINADRAAAGLPPWDATIRGRHVPQMEGPTAEQPSETPMEFLHRRVRENIDALLTEARVPVEEGSMDYTENTASREMTPNEIRADELAQALDFITGDPIDGSPSKKKIIKGIQHRLQTLRSMTSMSYSQTTSYADAALQPELGETVDQTEPDFDTFMREKIEEINGLAARAADASAEHHKTIAVNMAMDLLEAVKDVPPADALIDPIWQRRLATSVAAALVTIIDAS